MEWQRHRSSTFVCFLIIALLLHLASFFSFCTVFFTLSSLYAFCIFMRLLSVYPPHFHSTLCLLFFSMSSLSSFPFSVFVFLSNALYMYILFLWCFLVFSYLRLWFFFFNIMTLVMQWLSVLWGSLVGCSLYISSTMHDQTLIKVHMMFFCFCIVAASWFWLWDRWRGSIESYWCSRWSCKTVAAVGRHSSWSECGARNIISVSLLWCVPSCFIFL